MFRGAPEKGVIRPHLYLYAKSHSPSPASWVTGFPAVPARVPLANRALLHTVCQPPTTQDRHDRLVPLLSHAQLLHARECQASADTAVRHQPKLCKASAEHVLSCISRNRTGNESGRRDSNSRPPTWKAGALPTELLPRRAYFRSPTPTLAGDRLGSVLDPGLAFRIDLLLPDRHGALQLVNQPLAGVERLAPVRRRHCDHDANLAHLECAGAVDDCNVRDRPAPAGFVGQLLDLPLRHRAIGFIDERPHQLATRLLANHSLEHHERAIAVTAGPIGDRHRVERILAQRHQPVALADGAAAHWWDHRQLVALLQGVIPAGVLGIHRAPEGSGQRAQVVTVT